MLLIAQLQKQMGARAGLRSLGNVRRMSSGRGASPRRCHVYDEGRWGRAIGGGALERRRQLQRVRRRLTVNRRRQQVDWRHGRHPGRCQHALALQAALLRHTAAMTEAGCGRHGGVQHRRRGLTTRGGRVALGCRRRPVQRQPARVPPEEAAQTLGGDVPRGLAGALGGQRTGAAPANVSKAIRVAPVPRRADGRRRRQERLGQRARLEGGLRTPAEVHHLADRLQVVVGQVAAVLALH